MVVITQECFFLSSLSIYCCLSAALPHKVKGMMVRGAIPPPMGPPPNEPSDSEDELDYDDVDAITIFEMQNSDKKPQSLESEGSKGQLPQHDSSSTCTTPGSEVGSTPPATLAKSKTNRSSSDTPAIPIRRSKSLHHCLLWILLPSLVLFLFQ